MKIKLFTQFLLLILLVVILSHFSTVLWNEKPEEIPEIHVQSLVVDKNLTIAQFGQKNNLSNPILKQAFGLNTKKDLEKMMGDLNLTEDQIKQKIEKSLTLSAEFESKNWLKIPLKFTLWILFLLMVFILMRKRKITSQNQKILYLIAIVVFGVILGSDPSPMGTIKDAIVLYGTRGVIFPPRLIAMFAFLVMVLIANKFVCSWGCQLGTLQDLIFRLNRIYKEKQVLPQFKIPFVILNTIRILSFIALSIVAFIWATDIVEHIDPFKIFKPAILTTIGWVFIGTILIASLFIYRPWCTLFCPFGLVGWIVEKISIFKIKVDYDKCISCQACSKACPSTVMEAILKREKIIPDCFACGTCIEICPVKAISLSADKRNFPPDEKFAKKPNQ